LREKQFPIELLPDVVDAGSDAGKLHHPWFFIPKGTPITAGMGDVQVGKTLTFVKVVSASQYFSFKVFCPINSY